MSYALLFRTHFWNDYTARSFERMQKAAPSGDVYVCADETFKPVPCPDDVKLSHSVERFKDLGLAAFPEQQTMWYNGDYPLYAAAQDLPTYDYYIMVEFDVILNKSADAIVNYVRQVQADAVTNGYREEHEDWPWYSSARSLYPVVYGSVNPFLLISREALITLYYARLLHSRRLAAGQVSDWPYCEAFIASELHSNGYKVAEITQFGPTRRYDWWPPYDEGFATGQLTGEGFIHPVLAGDDYLRSLARYQIIDDQPVQRDTRSWEAEFQRLKRDDPAARTPEGWAEAVQDWHRRR